MQKKFIKKMRTINSSLNRKNIGTIGKILILIMVITGSLNPLSSSAETLSTKDSLAVKQIRNTIQVIDELLIRQVRTDTASKENFVNHVNDVHKVVEENVGKITSVESLESPVFDELFDKLGKLDIKVDPYINGYKSAKSTSWRYGDILYYGVGNKNAIGDKSLTGHTAVLSTTPYYVIEAGKTLNGSKVHHWNRSYLWQGASGIRQYKVTTKLGTDATTTERKAAVQYGLDQVGEPYKLVTPIGNETEWYCSKLTNAQWNSVGYNLQSSAVFTIEGLLIVTPANIISDLNVRLVKNWGTEVPTYL